MNTETIRRTRTLGALLALLPNTEQAAEVARQHDLMRLRIEWSGRMTAAAGKAQRRPQRDGTVKRVIKLSTLLLKATEADVRETLLHELAHHLDAERTGKFNGHSRPWQQACVDVGIPGQNRCHALEPFMEVRRNRVKRTCRIVAVCSRCSHELIRTRALPRGKVYRHVKCGGVFTNCSNKS